MINIRITGDKEIINGLQGVMHEIPRAGQNAFLDPAARDTQAKMIQEAPDATGMLRSSIKIDRPNQYTREIYPDVEYGFYQETRHKMPQRKPPIEKIKAWADAKGFDSKFAFLLARKIEQAGYPSNPFVLRTYRWVQMQIVKHAENFLNIIAAQYMAGRETKTFKV